MVKNSKWVWSGNTTITNRRQPRGTVRKSRSTITRHQENKLSKATSSLFPIKITILTFVVNTSDKICFRNLFMWWALVLAFIQIQAICVVHVIASSIKHNDISYKGSIFIIIKYGVFWKIKQIVMSFTEMTEDMLRCFRNDSRVLHFMALSFPRS